MLKLRSNFIECEKKKKKLEAKILKKFGHQDLRS